MLVSWSAFQNVVSRASDGTTVYGGQALEILPTPPGLANRLRRRRQRKAERSILKGCELAFRNHRRAQQPNGLAFGDLRYSGAATSLLEALAPSRTEAQDR